MKEKGMFKKGLFGFKKKDVLNYVYDLTAEHKKETDELLSKISELEAELTSSEEKCVSLEQSLSEAKSEYENTLDVLKGVTEECAEYKELTENLKKRVFYFTSRKEAVEREIKAAREYAEKTIADAKRKADGIIRDSRIYTETVEANVELIKKDAEEIRADIKESLLKLEENLERLSELGADRPTPVLKPRVATEKKSSSLLREIRNIFRGVGY